MSGPSGPPTITQRTVEFHALDGVALVGDLALPEVIAAGVVVCHPHPQYGGSRFDRVVGALFHELPQAGHATLRFDFRSEFDDGVGERLDALGALDELATVVGEAPLVAVGYSFGAWVALGLDDDRIAATVAIAPPLAVMDPVGPPRVPTLVLTPAHDQFSPPASSEPVIAEWRARSASSIDHRTIEMADHFLAGRTELVARSVATWLHDHVTT
jgi:alpha/beta superfamily hydrolase